MLKKPSVKVNVTLPLVQDEVCTHRGEYTVGEGEGKSAAHENQLCIWWDSVETRWWDTVGNIWWHTVGNIWWHTVGYVWRDTVGEGQGGGARISHERDVCSNGGVAS